MIDHSPVVSRVGDQEDRSFEAHVTRLGRDRSLDGLNVVKVRFRLDEDLEAHACDDGVRAPPVACQRNWNLRAPLQPSREPPMQTPEEGEVPAVTNGLSVRVETDAQLEANDGGDLRGQVDPQGTRLAAERSSHGIGADAESTGELAEAEPSGSTCVVELSGRA
jgi:hypothetical protein